MNGKQSKKQRRELRKMYSDAVTNMAHGDVGKHFKKMELALKASRKARRTWKALFIMMACLCLLSFIALIYLFARYQ